MASIFDYSFRNPSWDLRYIIFGTSILSGLYLIVERIRGLWGTYPSAPSSSVKTSIIIERRSWNIFQSIRLAVVSALFAISVFLFFLQGKTEKQLNIFFIVYSLYGAALSVLTLLGPRDSRYLLSSHLSFIHFVAFSIYIVRDIFPLAVGEGSADEQDGPSGWIRLALLGVSGFIIPIILPRKGYPEDSEAALSLPLHATASWLSYSCYSFLDPIVYTAFKKSNLQLDEVPALTLDDQTKSLTTKSAPLIDPVELGHSRSLIWGMLSIFKNQYFVMGCIGAFQSLNEFSEAIATNRILKSLEKGNSETKIETWVWILLLVIGPVIGSLIMEFALHLQNIVNVRFQAILTQLILTHSLRVRMDTVWTSSGSPSAITGSSESAPPASPATSATVISETASASRVKTEDDGASNSTTSTPAASSSQLTPEDEDSAEIQQADGVGAKKTQDDHYGKINNFLTSDMDNIRFIQEFFRPVWSVFRALLSIGILYTILGWSVFVGFAVMIACIPIPGYTSKLLMRLQREKMKTSDTRLSAVNQAMNALRMIKFFAWESRIESQIADKRAAELWYIFWNTILQVCNNSMNALFPLAAMLSTYATFTLGMGGELTASRLFSSMVVFGRLESYLGQIFWVIPEIVDAKVSLDRVAEFVNNGERYSTAPNTAPEVADVTTVHIRDAVFTWDKPSSAPAIRQFKLEVNGELKFHTGRVNLICGPTASGKTSLLMALLGELHFLPLSPSATCHLPRGGGVAYAAQESWVLNATIKDNILFGLPYEKSRFDKVIYQTGLLRDLSLFEAGDLTEVGERGITLSGGQKARITLARAVYSTAEVVLLDDVLSALDVHTARWVAEKCIGGDLLKGRTVLLVTHNILLCTPIADYVISLGPNGKIVSQGTVDEALKKNHALKAEIEAEKDALRREEEVEALEGSSDDVDTSEKSAKAGKLIVAEEMAIGHVTWASVNLYISSLGGPFFFVAFFVGAIIESLFDVITKWFYGYWSSQYEGKKASEVHVHRYLGMASGLEVFHLLVVIGIYSFFATGAYRASRSLHQRLTKSVLACTLRWLDTTPVSRVLTRFSQDCQAIDSGLPSLVSSTTRRTIKLAIYLITVIIASGWPALSIGIIVAASGVFFGQLYIKAQLPLKRHLSTLRAPVLGHVGTALQGLVSIRAYGAQEAFIEESMKRIDAHTRVARTYWCLNRWIGVRMDMIAIVFSGVVISYMVYGRETPAATVGFTLVLINSFSRQLLEWVRQVNNLEVQSNSVERIKEFLEIDHEPEPKKDSTPPAYWPSSGDLHVEKVSARYAADGPEVLKNVTFSLQSGQRMGIVGRTGAGKSTIALALLRAIPTTGSVVFDGIDTSRLNLSDLRSNITIIPQHPELLSGTLRENLDPFGEHDDATLNNVLRAAGLYHTQDSEGGIGLDTDVNSGGSNFSQGQRQILALARAILRRSKIVILDEATAAIDHRTDRAIQESLRTELKDVTVITVAHRLQTVMDSDKILVLDAGSVVELDAPSALLRKEGGLFRGLVDGSPDRDELYSVAGL
ncbi:P-loop containing nucleoside triphosphate hydrolase protein [Sistotremastrum suecicum HHB10207 ss-3]|uniref:p-loop containing nucleoside triphosphate hydrolase protein n=1 Tax=Sistotremastrum suecicum HHB10207 ss-3 TaxID=1314776 RepID=A0A166BIH7_9AGAM|nr:P-loop containing nucleoside triphosphate hydrolase protein [Sistotremastrum suecicum HHB10207 ss-3]